MAFDGGQWTISGTAASITAILSPLNGDKPSGGWHAKQLLIGNKIGATQPLYVGKANVTAAPTNALVEIAPGVTRDIGATGWGGPLDTDAIFLVGTANAANIAFIAIVI